MKSFIIYSDLLSTDVGAKIKSMELFQIDGKRQPNYVQPM